VLWNLVRNAVQVSGAGRVVRVKVEATDGGVDVLVQDEGPGIPAEERERVFDAFYTRRTHGTGIGLAVVKRIIDDHGPEGAAITIEDGEPRGSVFRVTLQAGTVRSMVPPPDDAAPRPAKERPAASRRPAALPGPR
jgi:signal transduction histidine kinase